MCIHTFLLIFFIFRRVLFFVFAFERGQNSVTWIADRMVDVWAKRVLAWMAGAAIIVI